MTSLVCLFVSVKAKFAPSAPLPPGVCIFLIDSRVRHNAKNGVGGPGAWGGEWGPVPWGHEGSEAGRARPGPRELCSADLRRL